MTFVDTNYFLRFLLNDNEAQHQKATDLFLEGADGKINLITSTIVFFEIYWVLSSFYEKRKTELVEMLEKILNLNFIILSERQILFDSLSLFKRTNFNLEDCYNLYYAKSENVKNFMTFDQKLSKEFKK